MGAMSENDVLTQEPQFAALVGIDWADQKHAWCLQAAGHDTAGKRRSGAHAGSGRGLDRATLSTIRESADRGAVEQVKGALVFMLSKYEPLHLFPVPPA